MPTCVCGTKYTAGSLYYSRHITKCHKYQKAQEKRIKEKVKTKLIEMPPSQQLVYQQQIINNVNIVNINQIAIRDVQEYNNKFSIMWDAAMQHIDRYLVGDFTSSPDRYREFLSAFRRYIEGHPETFPADCARMIAAPRDTEVEYSGELNDEQSDLVVEQVATMAETFNAEINKKLQERIDDSCKDIIF